MGFLSVRSFSTSTWISYADLFRVSSLAFFGGGWGVEVTEWNGEVMGKTRLMDRWNGKERQSFFSSRLDPPHWFFPPPFLLSFSASTPFDAPMFPYAHSLI